MSEAPPREAPPPLRTVEEGRAYYLELEGLLRAATQAALGGTGPLRKRQRRVWVQRGRVLAAISVLAERFPVLMADGGVFDARSQEDLALPIMPPSDRTSVQHWLPRVVSALREMRSLCDVPLQSSVQAEDQIMAERIYLTCLGVVLESLRLWTSLGVLDQRGFELATHEAVQTSIPTLIGTVSR